MRHRGVSILPAVNTLAFPAYAGPRLSTGYHLHIQFND